MRKVFILVTLFLLLTMSMRCFALECDVNYDTTTNVVNLDGVAKAPVSVYILPKDVDASEMQNEKSVAIAQYDFNAYTSFNETLQLDKNMASGEYNVIIKSNERYMSYNSTNNRLYGVPIDNYMVVAVDIYHVNIVDGLKIIDELNKHKTNATDLYDTILHGSTGTEVDENGVSYLELLSLDAERFTRCGLYACKQMVGTKNGNDFEGVSEVTKLFDEYQLLYEAINDNDTIGYIENNSSVFNADIKRFVTDIDEAAQVKLVSLIKNFNASGTTFSQEIPKLSALATVQSADRWQTIKKVVTQSYKDVLSISYSSVKNLDKVFQKMMDYDYKTFADIKTNFDKAKSDVNATSSGPIVSGGSSGGGGGGVSIKVQSNKEETKPVTIPSKKTFIDVSENFWGYDAVSTLAEKNIISGYPDGRFLPEGKVTRAEFVKLFVEAFSLDKKPVDKHFDDVNSGDWYYEYVCAAYSNGIINGISDSEFNPNGLISREDASIIMYRYLSNMKYLKDDKLHFSDLNTAADYARDAIEVLAGNKIVNGIGDNVFAPKDNIDRASCATLILKSMQFTK